MSSLGDVGHARTPVVPVGWFASPFPLIGPHNIGLFKMQKSNILSPLIDMGYHAKPPMRWPTYDGAELDRSQFMTSSEAANCERRIKFHKTSTTGSSGVVQSYGFMERGNTIETWVVDMMRAALPDGWDLQIAGTDQVSFHFGHQSGTPDGYLVTQSGKRYTVEIKSIDGFIKVANLPKFGHVEQCQQNMVLMELCQYPVDGCILLYVNASNYQVRTEFLLEKDEAMMHNLEMKAKRIMNAATPHDLEPTGLFIDKQCTYCDFKKQCGAALEQEKKDAATMRNHERAGQNVFK